MSAFFFDSASLRGAFFCSFRRPGAPQILCLAILINAPPVRVFVTDLSLIVIEIELNAG